MIEVMKYQIGARTGGPELTMMMGVVYPRFSWILRHLSEPVSEGCIALGFFVEAWGKLLDEPRTTGLGRCSMHLSTAGGIQYKNAAITLRLGPEVMLGDYETARKSFEMLACQGADRLAEFVTKKVGGDQSGFRNAVNLALDYVESLGPGEPIPNRDDDIRSGIEFVNVRQAQGRLNAEAADHFREALRRLLPPIDASDNLRGID